MPEQPQPQTGIQAAPDDPYAGRSPVDVQSTDTAPPDPHPGQSPAAPKSPWASTQPAAPVKDPAVRMDAPDDPGAAFMRSGTGAGIGGSGGGTNELILAGIGRIIDGQERILRMLENGATF